MSPEDQLLFDQTMCSLWTSIRSRNYFSVMARVDILRGIEFVGQLLHERKLNTNQIVSFYTILVRMHDSIRWRQMESLKKIKDKIYAQDNSQMFKALMIKYRNEPYFDIKELAYEFTKTFETPHDLQRLINMM